MRKAALILTIYLLPFISLSCLHGQEAFYDQATKFLLDSLDQRITALENEIPRLSETRATNYFFTKRDLDITIFLKHYHKYVFEEELDNARDLVESRIKAVQKRGDKIALDFYKEYRQKINNEVSDQQRHYQALFKKEKNFRKEFYRFVEIGDEYSLKRAQRMTDLALKYATEKSLTTVCEYLYHYEKFVQSLLYDYYSEYDLYRLTRSEAVFQKTFKPLIESDSLELIEVAGELVDHCYNFATYTSSNLDTVYFAKQKKVLVLAVSDFYARKGSQYFYSSRQKMVYTVKLDSLLTEGIYKWNDNIVVVGNFKPKAVNRSVRKGEAIINADRKLIEFLRINRLAKMGKELKLGYSYLIPYDVDEKMTEFMYNPHNQSFQYIVCYTKVENSYVTKRIGQNLPPLQFSNDI